ncbi:TetR/AcrR family transcriptional regulator [Actinoplanes sp. N902-109]|uniref:TetR/AcrR family transcriptional regulator n=1 Tax=Actinoplanes sp. (strain N902-109) TaxID=649831 RepID=UPI000329617D|nr:TetR/AcrR family transcriptional regulator [Actinoplanes sp. N902-109]AGL14204.1 TetR family transcriptional regulator [Actinoplanes sp. N902-109]
MRRTRDPDGTRRRIIEAATADFALYGIAGARVDRIAAAADVNKAQLYTYFGHKTGLFDAVFRQHADAMVAEAPFTPDDLPAYAVAIYDAALERPDILRLLVWARLEGVDIPQDQSAVEEKIAAIAAQQAAGSLTKDISAEDILALVTSTALTWSLAGMSPVPPTEKSSEHKRHRAALRQVVERSFAA